MDKLIDALVIFVCATLLASVLSLLICASFELGVMTI